MDDEYILKFGVYKGKKLHEVAKDFPSYLLWIGGVTTKYSVTKKAKDLYAIICEENPDDVQAVKTFIDGRCRSCWEKLNRNQKHSCNIKKAETFYHYHPYGKRT